MNRRLVAIGLLSAFAVSSGCETTSSNVTSQVPLVDTAPTETVAVSGSTEATVIAQSTMQTPPPPTSPTQVHAVDILSNMKKPCGTVAADAPKFVKPETK